MTCFSRTCNGSVAVDDFHRNALRRSARSWVSVQRFEAGWPAASSSWDGCGTRTGGRWQPHRCCRALIGQMHERLRTVVAFSRRAPGESLRFAYLGLIEDSCGPAMRPSRFCGVATWVSCRIHARESRTRRFPTRFFDYVASSLAVVSSDAVPAARSSRNRGGLVFRAEKVRISSKDLHNCWTLKRGSRADDWMAKP